MRFLAVSVSRQPQIRWLVVLMDQVLGMFLSVRQCVHGQMLVNHNDNSNL